jgi:hypothetical protein
VEVDNDGLVGSKQALESLFVQCMRMLTSLTKNEEIINIDNSNSDTGVSENGSSGNGLESDFNTTSNKDDIGVETALGRESLPDGCTGDTVLLGLRHQLYSKQSSLFLTSSTESQVVVGFLDPTIKEMLFLARRQWSTVLTLELASAGK